MRRLFRLEEAESLLPTLERSLRQLGVLKQEHERAGQQLEAMLRRVHEMGGMLVNREMFLARRARRDATAMRLKEVYEEMHGLGCQLKDLDAGLVDFPTLFQGEEVLLCWRLGEPGIGFWHRLEEGFGGRKPIDDHFRRNHQGDASI